MKNFFDTNPLFFDLLGNLVENVLILCYNSVMKNQGDKKNLIFTLLLPLCKNKEGNLDIQKTLDCKKMLQGWGVTLMVIGTLLLIVGFVGMIIQQTAWSPSVVWYWVAVAFGTLFTCLGIGTINTSTNLETYVKKQMEEPSDTTSETKQ